jgi:hypothetical protein
VGSYLVLLVPAMALALIPASIAAKKGRSFGLWWIYGFALFLVALIHALLADDLTRRPCPYCAEQIRPEATVCHFCHRDIDQVPLAELHADSPAVPSFERASDDQLIAALDLIVAHDGMLEPATAEGNASFDAALGQLVERELLQFESWDRVVVTDAGQRWIEGRRDGQPTSPPTIGAPDGADARQQPPAVSDRLPVDLFLGDERVLCDGQQFTIERTDGSVEQVDLREVVAIGVDSGIAVAWFQFDTVDGQRDTITFTNSAYSDAQQLAATLQKHLDHTDEEPRPL